MHRSRHPVEVAATDQALMPLSCRLEALLPTGIRHCFSLILPKAEARSAAGHCEGKVYAIEWKS